MNSDSIGDDFYIFAQLSRLEKLRLLLHYCNITNEDMQLWENLTNYNHHLFSNAFKIIMGTTLINTQSSENGVIVIRREYECISLKKRHFMKVFETLPNGRIALGTPESPFSHEFLLRHEEYLEKQALLSKHDFDSMMILAVVVVGCLHCHTVCWRPLLEDAVQRLILLPRSPAPLPSVFCNYVPESLDRVHGVDSLRYVQQFSQPQLPCTSRDLYNNCVYDLPSHFSEIYSTLQRCSQYEIDETVVRC
ncbi:hypothetical protein DICVIV_00315 [Dictyocaulus viviparus]|uniref:Uncharacterized protein n=1 Tax=Dictyocaulus viviparus TaxID=29172 RepID=A0A0D8Y9Z1_DICVI|nr:hypothetical protein DICVIV_00315 [Dictyocaulus viviparus]